MKTDSNGERQWQRTIRPENARVGRFTSIVRTDDGGYLAGGWSSRFRPTRGWVVKTNSNGRVQWQKTIIRPRRIVVNSVVQARGGDYVLAGESDAGALAVRLSPDGETTRWTRIITPPTRRRGSFGDGFSDVVRANDDGFALVGTFATRGRGGGWFVRVGRNGRPQRNRTYGRDRIGLIQALVRTDDGGYALVSGDTNGDAWLMRTNATGRKRWKRTYSPQPLSEFWSVLQTRDGGFVCAGAGSRSGLRDRGVVVKTDAAGRLQWQRVVDGRAEEYLTSVIRATGGGFICAGWSAADFFFTNVNGWLVKIGGRR